MELSLSATLVFITLSGLMLVTTAACLVALSARAALVRQPQSLQGLRPTDRVPLLALHATDGTTYQVPNQQRPTLLVFADSKCRTCVALIPELNAFVEKTASGIQVIVVTPGSVQHAAHFAEETGLQAAIVGDEGLIASTYRVNVSPIAALIGTDGRIVAMTRPSSTAVPDLLARLSRVTPA